ncbi:MAG: glycine cleavage system protein H, partial [Bacteroidales bacterium]|nr:glycine cleavage system protein H [Bacteroidales bacterium]
MNIPTDLLYSRDHEWLRIEGETATLGITEFAQDELGEIVFVEVNEMNKP